MEMKDSTGTVHEVDVDLDRIDVDARPGRLWLDGHLAHVAKVGDDWWVHLDGRIEVLTVVEQGAGGGGDDGGMTVEEGQALLVMEAMKMEHRIAANQAGTITDIHHDVGGQVAAGAVLIDIEPVEESN